MHGEKTTIELLTYSNIASPSKSKISFKTPVMTPEATPNATAPITFSVRFSREGDGTSIGTARVRTISSEVYSKIRRRRLPSRASVIVG
jgi:hypothetical protein